MSIRILQGDVRERLAELTTDSFDCIVTSPPYWGLRDYGTAKWEGGSDDCSHRPDDTPGLRGIASSTLGGGKNHTVHKQEGFKQKCPRCGALRIDNQIGLEPTLTEYLDTMIDVCRELRRVLKPSGTFWLNVGDSYAATGARSNNNGSGATGLMRDGRNEESRLASAAKTKTLGMKLPPIDHGLAPKQLNMVPNRLAIRLQEDGWYVRSEIIWHKPNPMPESVTDRPTSSHEKIWLLTKSANYWYDAEAIKERATKAPMPMQASDAAIAAKSVGPMSRGNGINHQFADPERLWAEDGTRNARNVWTIASQPYSEAHFATFPPELAERCIKAGCPAGGSVLDPFGGAGTTGLVADRLGRDATLIELNPTYVSLIKNRIAEDAGMFAQVAAE